jgi:hypothetical protein
MFDHLTWAFLFHTVCGEVGFNYALKVADSAVSPV